ncbi:hypothetical protein RD792_009913 [Penstemon davidsonii]|uniref:BHLH domain-containing protein n=1 Tax=Penstemon davidsonii TaxID=160366 RepID=A0ABR0D0E1_9LAMI|nr:hypothetical protein RD792_009913 [Penstemon davidsonii]
MGLKRMIAESLDPERKRSVATMGYLLKEALKTLCGVNQWSYAVFWKIGCQNPKLLIWEECYYETASCSGLNPETSFQDYNASWISTETRNLESSVQTREKLHFLVNKMMMDNYVNIVGEGLVGRVAFTGNHQWILSDNYFEEPRPPEVLKEMCQQFSAGMQTIAVIPVLPYGVVQFGSNKTITENVEFVNDVTSLILQLGYVPGVLLSEDHVARELDPRIGQNSSIESNVTSTSSLFNSFNYNNDWQSNIASFEAASSSQIHVKMDSAVNLDFSSPNQLINGVAKAEVIPSNSEIWMNQNASPYIPRPNQELPYRISSINNSSRGNFSNTNLSTDTLMSAQRALSASKEEIEHTKYDNACVQLQSSDDLFDILGADFKNKLFGSCWNSSLSNESAPKTHNSSEMYSTSAISSSTNTDHLLDSVVSTKVDENVSCGTTLTNMSTSSALPYGRFGVSDHMKGELFGVPKYLSKAGAATSSCSLRTGSSKGDSGTYSQSSSVYRSQGGSWTEKGQNSKKEYSKKTDETGKTNRKRLKPGENPRPRPKDRQMIQDRVKELREIVPNAAKCSIDALLERTIKHMLFLQSVTKHADKLKETRDSKIISKDGGLLLKDNFDGGATWAYEVGSQSMVCPIIVEDLNQPRQMLVEMLCEERGLFLEIADIIRGLGLTILKGVMETRNDKIWARFAVEANRDVTRMEIFISLVRLLEQSANNGASQPNGISSEN